jgi:hypothetical protein
VLVEVVGGQLRLLYPLHNLPRHYVEPPAEVPIHQEHHVVVLDGDLTASLQGVGSDKLSRRWPLCLRTKDPSGSLAFYLFPTVRRHKELLLSLLRSRAAGTGGDEAVAAMVREVVAEGQRVQPRDCAIEIINVLASRLDAGKELQRLIQTRIKRIFQRKVNNHFGQFLKNHLSLMDFHLGRPPLLRSAELLAGEARPEGRGVWGLLTLTCGEGGSIVLKTNRLNLPTEESEDSDSDTDSEGSSAPSEEDHTLAGLGLKLAASLVHVHDLEQLTFTLTIDRVEMAVLVNLPPPHANVPDQAWFGLAKQPLLELRVEASGASSRVNNFLNSFILPIIRRKILKKVFQVLGKEWVYPHMREFIVPGME